MAIEQNGHQCVFNGFIEPLEWLFQPAQKGWRFQPGEKRSDDWLKSYGLGVWKRYGLLIVAFGIVGALLTLVERWMGGAGKAFFSGLRSTLFDAPVWWFFISLTAYQSALYVITGPVDRNDPVTRPQKRFRRVWSDFRYKWNMSVSSPRLVEISAALFVAWSAFMFGIMMTNTFRNMFFHTSLIELLNPFAAFDWASMRLAWIGTAGIGIVILIRLTAVKWVNDSDHWRYARWGGWGALVILLGWHITYIFWWPSEIR